MAARLTDRQKKKIIADYLEMGSYNAVATKNGVSNHTVKRVVLATPEMADLIQQKKDENTLEMLEYMDTRKGEAQSVIDLYLKALADPEKLEKATLSQIATALGIVVDKFTKGGERAALADDGFIEALNKKAGELWDENEHGDIPL